MEVTKIYLDRLQQRCSYYHSYLEKVFYSFKNEDIKLNDTDRTKVESILRESYGNNAIVFINAVSITNQYNGYQDVVISFKGNYDDK